MEQLRSPSRASSVISVVICTYNRARYLDELLGVLGMQDGLDCIAWEVIVVDNNSSDETKEIVQKHQARSNYPLRYICETRQGLAFGRQTGVENATGRIVGFLDDDNLPNNDWVREAVHFAERRPNACAWGSRIIPDPAIPQYTDFAYIAPYLALQDRGNHELNFSVKKGPRMYPPGAGLCVIRDLWLQVVPNKLVLEGPTKKNLITSEDLEALSYLRRAGDVLYNPSMILTHKVHPSRLEKKNFYKLLFRIGMSRHVIRQLNVDKWQRSFMPFVYLTLDLLRLNYYMCVCILQIDRSIVSRSKVYLYLGSIFSPFYLIFRKRKSKWLNR